MIPAIAGSSAARFLSFHYQPTQLVGIITGPLMQEEYKQQIYEIVRDRINRRDYMLRRKGFPICPYYAIRAYLRHSGSAKPNGCQGAKIEHDNYGICIRPVGVSFGSISKPTQADRRGSVLAPHEPVQVGTPLRSVSEKGALSEEKNNPRSGAKSQ